MEYFLGTLVIIIAVLLIVSNIDIIIFLIALALVFWFFKYVIFTKVFLATVLCFIAYVYVTDYLKERKFKKRGAKIKYKNCENAGEYLFLKVTKKQANQFIEKISEVIKAKYSFTEFYTGAANENVIYVNFSKKEETCGTAIFRFKKNGITVQYDSESKKVDLPEVFERVRYEKGVFINDIN